MEFFNFLLYSGFNFFLYGFLGWIIENVYCYIKSGHLQRDGFLSTPFKPMYAIAMTALIVINTIFNLNTILLIFFCLVIPTAVEYATGDLMRRYFKKDYWDYSSLKYNYRGIVSLRFSIYWTILTFIGVKYFQIYVVNNIYIVIQPFWKVMFFVLLIILVVDDLWSIKMLKEV